ncbi:TonB-dependent receptor [Puia dinghuensis]|uniref:TonB-dependent receptor n=1 Tax=Puia dinghuensis TaxID=1792502 RepID=A0A8J2UBV5_9BACT|nr:TonB-dependent receptor [Puia dinghuensis]GGA93901.1 TonB-dependent receptor [Puia dinghuensis]
MKFLPGILALLLTITANAQSRILGTITDEISKPIAGASIHLLNTEITTVSDSAGGFTIQHLTDGRYTLQLSAIGYATLATNIDIAAGDNRQSFRLANSLTQLDAVTVTAEKKEELLQSVPLSVSAISAQQVDDYRLWDIKGITAIVPNLYSGNSGDGRNVTAIRGITTTSYDPAVATYVDGVNQFSLDTYIPQLNDIERIEVLRGPQGTLFGRNAMGGVINIITKQPTNATHGFARVDEGNYGQQRYAAGIRTPLVKDVLFFGASAAYSKRDGYYTNDYNNTSFDRQSGFTGNYYLKYLPGAGWSATLNVKHQNNRNWGAFPLSPSAKYALSHPFHLSQNAVGKMIDNTLDASLAIKHSGNTVDFTAQTAWQHNYRYYIPSVDGDFSPADAVSIINNYGPDWNNVKVFTQELRLSSADHRNSPFNWTAGVYFFHQDDPKKVATHFGADAALVGSPQSNFSSIDITTGKNTGVAGYGQVSYAVTSQWQLIAGLRYDYEHRYLDVEGQYQKDGHAVITVRPDTSAALHFSALSPKAGIKYLLNPHTNIYATYSRAYRPGGLTQLSTAPTQPPLYPYQPEYSNNIEAGIKNTWWEHRLELNITAFLSHVNNAQVPTLILPSAITVTRNTGKLISEGLELEAAANPVKGLQLQYSFGYTDAHYQSLDLSQNGHTVDLAGKKQIYTPELTSMLSPQYSLLLNARRQLKLVLHGEWFYLGKEYFDLNNKISQSPHSILNARAGLTIPHLELFFWMRNLTDTKYIEYAYDFGAAHLGDPQTWGVTLKTSW